MSIEEKVKLLEERVAKLENFNEEIRKQTIKVLQSKINLMEAELKAKGLPSFDMWIKGEQL